MRSWILLILLLSLGFEANGILTGCSGNGHVCVVLDDGLIKCWGSNNRGQLGLGDYMNRGDVPNQVPAPFLVISELARDVVCGDGFSCFLSTSGNVYCWGDNTRGQLGIGSIEDSNPTVSANRVKLDGNSIGLCAGDGFVCSVMDDTNSSVVCWGANNLGQLGLGDTKDRGRSSEDFPLRSTVEGGVKVVCGANHVFVEKIDGSWIGWGDNRDGQLAIGRTYPPFDIIGDGEGDRFIVPRVGGMIRDGCGGLNHSCFVVGEDIRCSGDNTYGQLGYPGMQKAGNTIETIPLPVVNIGYTGRRVYCFKYHSCVIGIIEGGDNNVSSCFGRNDIGQLGRQDRVQGIGIREGTMPSMTINITVDRNSGYLEGSSNLDNGYIIVVSGLIRKNSSISRDSLIGWGDNSKGQLLIGTNLSSSIETVMCNVECGDYLVDSQGGEDCDIGTKNDGQFCTPFCNSVLCLGDECLRCLVDIEVYSIKDVGCWYNDKICDNKSIVEDAVCIDGEWQVYRLYIDNEIEIRNGLIVATDYIQTKKGILKLNLSDNVRIDVVDRAILNGVLLVDDVYQSWNKSVVILTANEIIGGYNNISLLSGICASQKINTVLGRQELSIEPFCEHNKGNIGWYWFLIIGIVVVVISLMIIYSGYRLFRSKKVHDVDVSQYEPINDKKF